MNGEWNRFYCLPPTSREVSDLEDNEYLSIDGDIIRFEEIEWLEGSNDCSRYLIDGDSVWLNEDFEEVE